MWGEDFADGDSAAWTELSAPLEPIQSLGDMADSPHALVRREEDVGQVVSLPANNSTAGQGRRKAIVYEDGSIDYDLANVSRREEGLPVVRISSPGSRPASGASRRNVDASEVPRSAAHGLVRLDPAEIPSSAIVGNSKPGKGMTGKALNPSQRIKRPVGPPSRPSSPPRGRDARGRSPPRGDTAHVAGAPLDTDATDYEAILRVGVRDAPGGNTEANATAPGAAAAAAAIPVAAPAPSAARAPAPSPGPASAPASGPASAPTPAPGPASTSSPGPASASSPGPASAPASGPASAPTPAAAMPAPAESMGPEQGASHRQVNLGAERRRREARDAAMARKAKQEADLREKQARQNAAMYRLEGAPGASRQAEWEGVPQGVMPHRPVTARPILGLNVGEAVFRAEQARVERMEASVARPQTGRERQSASAGSGAPARGLVSSAGNDRRAAQPSIRQPLTSGKIRRQAAEQRILYPNATEEEIMEIIKRNPVRPATGRR